MTDCRLTVLIVFQFLFGAAPQDDENSDTRYFAYDWAAYSPSDTSFLRIRISIARSPYIAFTELGEHDRRRAKRKSNPADAVTVRLK